MKKLILSLSFLLTLCSVWAQNNSIKIIRNDGGVKINVDGKDFMIKGMNWDFFPIGTNYNYSLWKQSDEFIKMALDKEMSLLKGMGVNTIRVYTGIPSKWITYIYDNYQIYTILNHSFGRYGLSIDGVWKPNTDYSSNRVNEILLSEMKTMAETFKTTRGLLLYLIGNENNYGLFWEGAETENIPIENRKSTKQAKFMYKLMNDAAIQIKSIDPNHLVSICNGDLMFLDIIAQECKDVDILGTNMYRGGFFGDAFVRVKKEYDKPLMFTEFGADAFNVINGAEDQSSQASYLLNNWKEIYENVAGRQGAGNAIGGCTFQFSDGWWKYKQTSNLDVHDVDASWSNGGYLADYEKGQNNMNEEWFGICAKGPTDERGLYDLYPRSAYYVLKDIHQINPYEKNDNILSQTSYFGESNLSEATLKANTQKSALDGVLNSKIRLSRLTAELTTFNTGGSLITTPSTATTPTTQYPNKLGFDHMQSFYIGIEANPISTVKANVEFNILGHVAENPIDQIFYENRGRPVQVATTSGTTYTLQSENRIQLYRASFNWNEKFFNLDGFYRTGHYHWGYEGDFFGLYREANYGPSLDIYNGDAPIGIEFTGKRFLQGLKFAFGPQLWWGANTAILIKYTRDLKIFTLTGLFQEDLEQRGATESSFIIPQPKTRKFTLHLAKKMGRFQFDIGGIWAGEPLNGRTFQIIRGESNNYVIYQDKIQSKDNWGGKVKVTYTGDKVNFYIQSAVMGLVASGGGVDNTQTFTGWRLKDSESGNQYNFLAGLTYNMNKFQIAPNFIWQKPLEGPIPADAPAPGRPRNIMDDPFAVRLNREMVAGELLLTFDPTPATWMYDWDNDRTEDAPIAVSAGFVYRHLPTTQDAAIGILADGRTMFAFNGAAPAKDLWESNLRIVSKMNADWGVIANLYGGDAQANGSDPRTIYRYGIDLRTIYKKVKLMSFVKFNDWGPYDYHRDFNLTYPLQLMFDLSTEIVKPDWFLLPRTKLGIRWTFRTLDSHSPRYNPTQTVDATGKFVPDPTAIGFPNGNEWEIRTYIHINVGK